MIGWMLLVLAVSALWSDAKDDRGQTLFREKEIAYGFWRACLIMLILGVVYATPIAGCVWLVRAIIHAANR